MSPVVSRELAAVLSSPHTTQGQAADALEEHIIYRRSKGDTLHDVSASLSLMEGKSPRLVPAIRQAQYVTNVPPAFGSNESSSQVPSSTPAAVLGYLLAEPMPPVHQSRKVLLEYVLSREARLREKKHGRGGKGTLGREGFEELADRMGEIEEGLRGTGPLAHASRMPRHNGPVEDENLSPARQTGLALVLSLRMLLSYFTLPDLAKQLLQQTPQDAERTLVQHIRRRVAGEGRYSVGKELEYVESLTLTRRPALRPAFRSARNRTQLAPRPLYPISLPAPSKSACIKMLTAFVREVEQAGPAAATAYMQAGPSGPAFPSGTDRPFRSRKMSPSQPTAGGFGSNPSSPTPGSPSKAGNGPPPTDTSPMENYTIELLSEFLMREKREYMLKNKWVKTGREQLSKDLGDVELALCTSGKSLTGSAPLLLPAFLLLRRTFALPSSPLPSRVTEQYFETLPSPPDPDSVPLREPTVSSTTAMLYVNPRLPDDVALDAVEELLESEREKGMNAAISQEKTIAWLNGLVDQVQKRFPDGSYEAVLEQARYLAAHPRVWPDASTMSSFPTPRMSVDEPTGHRRTRSSAHPSSVSSHDDEPLSPRERMNSTHSRSASMPMRTSLYGEYSDNGMTSPTRPRNISGGLSPYSPLSATGPSLLPYATNNTLSAEHVISDDSSQYSGNSANITMDETTSPMKQGLTGLGFQGISRVKEPPLLSLLVPGPELDLGIQLNTPSPTNLRFSAHSNGPGSAASGSGGWWDVISDGDEMSPAGRRAPWANRASGSTSSGQSFTLNSPISARRTSLPPPPPPPGASAPTVPDTNVTPQMDNTPKMNDGTPTNTPPKPYDSPITPQLAGDSPRSHGSTPRTTPNRKAGPGVQTVNTPPKPEPTAHHMGYDDSHFQPYQNGVQTANHDTSHQEQSRKLADSPYETTDLSRPHDYETTHQELPRPSYNDFRPSYNAFIQPAPAKNDSALSLESLRAAMPYRTATAEKQRALQANDASASEATMHSRQVSQTHSRRPSEVHSRQPSRSKILEDAGRKSSESTRQHSSPHDTKTPKDGDAPGLPPMPSMPSMPSLSSMPSMPIPRIPSKSTAQPEAPSGTPPVPESAAQAAARAEALSRLTGPSQPTEPSPPPPPPEPELTEEQEDLYASLDFMPSEYKSTMARKPAGGFSQQQSNSSLSRSMSKSQQGGLSRTMSKAQQVSAHSRSQSKTGMFGSGTKTTPMVESSRWQRRRPSDNQAPPLETSPQNKVDEFGNGPKSAPGLPTSTTWPHPIEESSQSADGHEMRSAGSLSRPTRAVPLTIDRPGFPSRPQQTSPTEPKGKFNLSSMMRAKREKEEPPMRARPAVSNNPGRWNRNMVSEIMGPSKNSMNR